jgi:P-type Mg2+ transporter
LAIYGKYLVSHEKPLPWYRQLLKAFIDPFIGVLFILAIASFMTEFVFALPQDKDLSSVIIITILILVNVMLAFIQEYQANQAADKLLDLIKNTTIVIREETGRQKSLTEEIIPGDIIHLSAGDIIPTDIRLFSTNN